ncbi:MAG: AbrB family DNA-binding protein [Parcubacteria group bacterium Gr01-1014_29]|nr:MAG: AbrB family DNA-binding protein [Parcubacteria group bacterium Gr01-1014_29]
MGVRIPKYVSEELLLREGAEVDVVVENKSIVISPTQKSKYDLKTLVSRITKKNRHGEVDWGTPRGKEIW